MAELSNVMVRYKNRKTLSITSGTYYRLAKIGKWSESADELINRILDEREGRENVSGGSS